MLSLDEPLAPVMKTLVVCAIVAIEAVDMNDMHVAEAPPPYIFTRAAALS